MKEKNLPDLPEEGTIQEDEETLKEQQREQISETFEDNYIDENFTNPHLIKDKNDEVFNPDIHESHDGVTPIYKGDGTFRRKRGRKKGQFSNPKKEEKMVNPATKAIAVKGTAIFFGLLEIIGEEEGTPIVTETYDEFKSNAESLYFLLEKKGLKSTPELDCALMFGGSLIARLGKPKTSAKIKGFFYKLFRPSFWGSIFKRKTEPIKKRTFKRKKDD